MLNQNQPSAPSTVDCLVPTGSESIPAVPKPAEPTHVAPPHSPEQHAEVMRMFNQYALDPYSETRIRDPISERWSRTVIRDHMVKVYMEADKDNRNKTIPQWLNILIANVSNHLLKLAEDCGSYCHCHLEQVICDCRLVQAWNTYVRNVDFMNAFKASTGIQTYVYHLHQREFKNLTRAHRDHPALEPFG